MQLPAAAARPDRQSLVLIYKRIDYLPLTKLDMERRPTFSNGYATSAQQDTAGIITTQAD